MLKNIRLLTVAALVTFSVMTGFIGGASAASRVDLVPVQDLTAGWNRTAGVGQDVIIVWEDRKNTRLTGDSKIHGYNVYRGGKYLGTVKPVSSGQSVFFFADRDGVASEDSRYRVQPVRANSSRPGGWEWGPFAWTGRFVFPVF